MRRNPGFLKLILPVLMLIAVSVMQTSAGVQTMLAHDALVGKWKATVTTDDASKETADNIEFKGGKFTSENEKNDGYDPATYEDNPAPQGTGAAKFDVTLTNKAGDTAKWSGTATGSEMTGTLLVTKKDGTTVSYTFKATKSK